MSGAAGAIEAGRSFIKFYADLSDLYDSFKTAGKETASVAKSIAENWSKQVSTGLDSATTAANSFGQQAATASGSASTGLQQVAIDANMASGAVGQVGRQFSIAGAASKAISIAQGGVKGIASAAWGAIGGLGGIAKSANAASWALRTASIAGRLMGKDVSSLEPWIRNLNRISWAAWGVNTAIKAASLTARSFSALASLPGRAVVAIGRVAGRLGRFGGIGAAGATAASAASAATGEEGDSASAVAGGALTGMMLGGPAGAAIAAGAVGLGLTIKTALSRGAMEGARDSQDFLTQLGVAMIDTGTWIKGVWDQIYGKFKSVFESMKTEGPSVFDRIREAVFPIVDAVQNIWLPAMFGAIDSIVSYFQSGRQTMGRTWTDWIVETVAGVADFVANFDIYFQMAQQTIVMWAGNAIVQFSDFFKNAGVWFDWFGKNWFDVLMTMADYASTVFINIGQNIRDNFGALWDWVSNGFQGDLNFNWTALDDGFRSTVSKWPDLVETELATTTPELDALSKQLAARQAAMEERRKNQTGPVEAAAGAVQDESRRARDTRFGAVSAQSQEAYAAISRYQNQQTSSKPELDVAKQQLTEFKGVRKSLDRIADNTRPAGFDQQRDQIP